MLTRRTLVAGIALAPVAARAAANPFAAIEAASGGRLGVAVLDTGSGRRMAWRADERFPMCSTFKLLAAAFVLARVDRGQERLDRVIAVDRTDLPPNSPATAKADAMTLAALAQAAVTVSDNGAANLMLDSFGGPAALTRFARSLGDRVTRLDRTEPDLNTATPGDPRDTTTPAAMLATLRTLLLGNALTPASCALLTGWTVAATTGLTALRAGLPDDWRVGDKTGAGEHGTRGDIAVAWPPGRAPVVIAAYLKDTTLDLAGRNAVMADVGRVVATIH